MNGYLRLRDPGVRAAMRHPALKGLPRMGRGAFAAVYDKGDTVLKLTCDPVSYEFAASVFRPQGEHFPRLVEDYFCVGETSAEEPLYLFEVEKLQPVRRDSLYHTKKEIAGLCKSVSNAWSKHRWTLRAGDDHTASYRALQELAGSGKVSEPMSQALGDLALFAGNYEGVIDFHKDNLMLRGDTIVLNDVIVGDQALAKFNKARGVDRIYG